MKKENRAFVPPENTNVSIWRYMDLVKFISLLESKTLYFSRADLLGDPYEGSHPRLFPKSDYTIEVKSSKGVQKETLSSYKFFEAHRRITFVNCWHMNKYESSAMWSQYIDGYGVAIQTSYRRFIDVINNQEERDVCVGFVKYIDYEKDSFPDNNNTLYPFSHKHKSFESESELRALITDPKFLLKAIVNPEEVPRGITVPIDLSLLIEKICLPPRSADYFKDVVTSICSKYQLNVPIVDSGIPQKPTW